MFYKLIGSIQLKPERQGRKRLDQRMETKFTNEHRGELYHLIRGVEKNDKVTREEYSEQTVTPHLVRYSRE